MVGGLAMKADELIPLGDSLAAQGVRSVFFDNLFVGDGPRPKELSALTIEDQARHHWSLIDSLGIPASEKISIFGISMGGMIAASMAVLRKNQVEKLFLAATSANLPEKPAIGDKLYAEWMNAKSPEVLERAVTIAFGKTCLKNKKEIKDEYLRYRLMAENKQSGKDFVMQIYSI
jgi:pimeloyl-ACP methyl ester carboxylesterase